MTEPLLLPSQESLAERLTHNISYAEQLQLVCGAEGAGKSFLLRYLNRIISDEISVFLSCPLHADDAEIRRKILLPLLSEPVFDDETSLTDSLVDFASTLKKPIVIIIDDAERLSNALWAELIGLSQLSVSGQFVSVIAAVTVEFEAQLNEALPESFQALMSSLYIETLSQQEQDALYYSLLSQSDGFENHLIAKPDFNQDNVYPKDIVAVFVKSANEHNEKVSKRTLNLRLLTVVALLFTLASLAWVYQQPLLKVAGYSDDTIPASEETTERLQTSIDLPVKDAAIVFNQIERGTKVELEGTKTNQQAKVEAAVSHIARPKPTQQQPDQLDEVTAETSGKRLKQKPVELSDNQQPELAHAQQTESKVERSSQILEGEVSKIEYKQGDVNAVKSVTKQLELDAPEVKAPNPESYTLQVATVSKQRSLNNLLRQLSPYSDVRIAKQKQRWVVVVGEFENYQLAQTFAAKLAKETELPKPWIRKWKTLMKLELQNPNKSSEN
ncbi:AAA family ATPase [Shewanella sp. 202IG2-18]|uniref:AAA family ATPase n=1 Tax=Parashewanella hymeniacidonis TaxID=2807618 RepID=UPI001961A96F|nr:AAA family ATPase [Parashewanella hymeniacidonis]MBM7072289.1 AAA family ATPase [Parashewanella hymeniacidonis]